MKKLIIYTALQFIIGFSFAQDIRIQKNDTRIFEGKWVGSLTYLDYTSGKPYTMPADLIVTAIPGTPHLLFRMIYPNEPKANGNDTIMIDQHGSFFDGAKVISKRTTNNGIVIVTEKDGTDGNEHRKAIIKKTYTVDKASFYITKEILFEGEQQWILRHTYTFNKK
ncbi:MAG: hypothetical protein IM562_07390 [Chitinophagaceae bacterium]|jgi:hypothetical protein|nr:hypothetical protein [Chitinophagaceae bacterium]MCA6446972.1 hypothetical protein [Chitinophagaceae bacterium]